LLDSLEMPRLVGCLFRHWRGPVRAAAPRDVDFHPKGLPASRRTDAVHGGGALDALGMRRIEEHERLLAEGDLLDLLPQQAAILHDRLVGSSQMLACAVLDRAHRFY